MVTKKFSFLTSILILIFMVGAGCSDTSTQTASMETYENKNEGFHIQHPKDWTKKEGAYGTTVAFVSPTNAADTFAENLTVTAKTTDASVEAYVDSAVKNAPKSYTDFKLLENQATTVSSEPAKMIVYTFTEGDYKVHIREYFTVKNGTLYDITFTSHQNNTAEHWDTAMKMIESFKITK